TNTMDLIDIHSMYKQLRVDPGASELSEGFPVPGPLDSSSKSKPCSTQVSRYMARRVTCSYLDQPVNSKNDMALAHTLDTPGRSLGRVAFTDLKHGAVTSFASVVQLGGKGYAPPESDLRKHVKGLSDFVHFTENLEEILGDNPNPRYPTFINGYVFVLYIRAALLKGRASGDVSCSIHNDTAKDLKEQIAQIHLSHRLQSASVTGISPARGLDIYMNAIILTLYGFVGRLKVLIALLDEDALAPPFRNKAVLLSVDQAVLTAFSLICFCVLRSPEVPTGSSPKPHAAPRPGATRSTQTQGTHSPPTLQARSQFACTYQDDLEPPLNRVLDFPSIIQGPTCVQQAPKWTLTTKAPSKKKLIAGQGKPTSFFRL
uniref:PCNA-interacting partner n=1 Tax=Oncorhynchus kisutch TaxID=8019 RepID=A0A8C7HT48_ONCKI